MRPLFRLLAPGGRNARLSTLIFHRVLPSRDPLFPDEPDVGRFDQILGWVGRWLNVLPLDEAVRRLRDASLPPRAASITFDDGYADNATHAMPILRKHGMTATFFVANAFLDGGRMWNDTIIESVRRARPGTYDLAPWRPGATLLSDAASRRSAIDTLLGHIKYLAPEERSAAVQGVHEALGSPAAEALMMSSGQLRALRDGGMQVGAHTCTHPILARTPDAAALAEIIDGKRELERLLNDEVTLFAYPNGKPGQDYLDRHVRMVRDAGFTAAVSTRPGVATLATDPFQLPRFSPWDATGLRYGARLLLNLRQPGPELSAAA